MSTTEVAANAETAAGLREIADLIEAHPELPQNIRAVVWMRDYRYTPEQIAAARSELETFAAALGPEAEEKQAGSAVRIRREFHGIEFHAEADVAHLAAHPQPTPAYEPILKPEDER